MRKDTVAHAAVASLTNGCVRALLAIIFAIAGLPAIASPSQDTEQARGAARQASPASAASIAAREDVAGLLRMAREREPQALDEQVELCEIPAPPFQEEARGLEYRRRFEEIGLEDVRTDAVGNVIGEWGRGEGPLVVLSAHLDTVFPEGTDVTVTRAGHLLRGPGIIDDCRGLTVVLSVARVLVESNFQPSGRIVFVATVGEEGPGNLRGVRNLFDAELAGRIDYFISVDGSGSSITHGAVGSNRYKVTFKGPGGHSYGAFGMPNPMHALGRAMAKIADFEVPSDPKVTFSIGLLEGGTSVNSIPFSASMSIDMRSIDTDWLGEIDSHFRATLDEALAEENGRWNSDIELTYEIEVIGIRPAGSQSEDAPIVRAAVEAARAAGIEPRLNASSTDSNIPISRGIPAVTIDGGGDGRGAHSPSVEEFDTRDSYKGTQWALLLSLALAGIE